MPSRSHAPATLPIGALADLPPLLRQMRQDPWALLAEFGITEASFVDSRVPVPVALFGRILDSAATTTGRPHIGLLLGETATLENVGELRFLLLNAATVRQALDHLLRFARLWHPAIHAVRVREHGFTRLTLTIPEDVPGADQILVAYTASIVRALRTVIGRAWSPSYVHLALHRPANGSPYRRFFGGSVQFDQRDYTIFIADAVLDTPRPGSDPRLAEFIFERLCALQEKAATDFVGQVRDAIEAQLLRGQCDARRVAAQFAVHRKTLHGHLREAGTTFSRVREECREALAVRLLEHTDLPLAEIATALGFGHQPSLTRAFRRWKGTTPSEWRRRASVLPAEQRIARRRQV